MRAALLLPSYLNSGDYRHTHPIRFCAFTVVRTAPTVPIARGARFGKNATM